MKTPEEVIQENAVKDRVKVIVAQLAGRETVDIARRTASSTELIALLLWLGTQEEP